MDEIGKVFVYVGNVLLFVLVSIIFLPAFLIVNYLQEVWTKQLSELFGY
ncbi:MAG TPA: hypothetical protein VGE18_03370 [Candidatus Paceibacterota bacterium]